MACGHHFGPPLFWERWSLVVIPLCYSSTYAAHGWHGICNGLPQQHTSLNINMPALLAAPGNNSCLEPGCSTTSRDYAKHLRLCRACIQCQSLQMIVFPIKTPATLSKLAMQFSMGKSRCHEKCNVSSQSSAILHVVAWTYGWTSNSGCQAHCYSGAGTAVKVYNLCMA